MKTLFTLILGVVCLLSKAQTINIPIIDGTYQYQEVVYLDSNTYKKDALYNNSKLYFIDSYRSSKDVIQLDDKDQGKIIGKGFFSISTNQKYNLIATGTIKWDVHYTTEILCKNGKYRYKIYDIFINDYERAEDGETKNIEDINLSELASLKKRSWFKKGQDKLCTDIVSQFALCIDNMKVYMTKSGSKRDEF
jgi:hypothetical protein